MSNNVLQLQHEGYLKKKCVLVYWLKGPEAVPKVWKYVTRYFFVIGNTLCYTRSKREVDKRQKYRIILTLSHIKDITFTNKKINIIMTSGQKVVLKGNPEDVTGWVTFLMPFKENVTPKSNSLNTPHSPRVFPRRRETLTKYPSPSSSVSAPSLSLSSPANTVPQQSTSLSAIPTRGGPSTSSSVSSMSSASSFSSAVSSPTTTPRNELIDDRVPWRENGTLRPYKPHEHSETYVPAHAHGKRGSKSPCTSTGSLVSSWSMNNIAEWDEPEHGVSDAPAAMSWDEWDAIFIKSQSLENVSHLSHLA